MYDNRVLITLIAISLIAGFVNCDQNIDDLKNSKLGGGFKELDAALVAKTWSSDGHKNMKIVEGFIIPEAESSTFLGIHNKKNLAKAAKLLLDLRRIKDEKICNREGLEVTLKNLYGIKKAGDPKRLRDILAYYMIRQEEVCMKVFPTILKEKLAAMDQSQQARLDYVMRESMFKHFSKRLDAKSLYHQILLNRVVPSMSSLVKTLKNVPIEITNDPELKKEMGTIEMDQLVLHRYLIEPCGEYIDNVAKDIFDVMQIYLVMHKFDESQPDFYYYWAKYKFCASPLSP